jgi:hypothetical protein
VLFNVLLGLIIALGVMVALSCLTLLVGYYWLSQRLRKRIAEVRALESLVLRFQHPRSLLETEQVREHVPPMEIRLVRSPATPDDQLIARIDHWLREHSFTYLGSFMIRPMDELLFTYLNQDRTLVAAIREANRADRIYVEFCFDLGEGQRGGISNPPLDTLPLSNPSSTCPSQSAASCDSAAPYNPAIDEPTVAAVGRYLQGNIREDFTLLSRLWLEAVELIDSEEVASRLQTIDPLDINLFYEEAHRHEMRQRVQTGGISEFELRASFAAQGIEATPGDIAEIQSAWQIAIQAHWIGCSARARDHLQEGGEVLAVSDSSLDRFLFERLSSFLSSQPQLDRSQLGNNLAELRNLLSRFSPRDALARFRPLLPIQLRYRLIDQIHHPLPVDFYMLPKA